MNEAFAPVGPKRRVLNYGQKIKLAAWFEDSISTLRDARATRQEAADRATIDLGFTVTEHNIKGIEDATGLSFYTPKPAPLTGDALADMHARLEGAMDALTEATNRTMESNTRMDLRLSTAFRDIATIKNRLDLLMASLKGQGFKVPEWNLAPKTPE